MTTGEIDFSDLELSEMGAEIAMAEGEEPRRPMMRVPSDDVPRGLGTQPTGRQVMLSTTDMIVERAFQAINGATSPGRPAAPLLTAVVPDTDGDGIEDIEEDDATARIPKAALSPEEEAAEAAFSALEEPVPTRARTTVPDLPAAPPAEVSPPAPPPLPVNGAGVPASPPRVSMPAIPVVRTTAPSLPVAPPLPAASDARPPLPVQARTTNGSMPSVPPPPPVEAQAPPPPAAAVKPAAPEYSLLSSAPPPSSGGPRVAVIAVASGEVASSGPARRDLGGGPRTEDGEELHFHEIEEVRFKPPPPPPLDGKEASRPSAAPPVPAAAVSSQTMPGSRQKRRPKQWFEEIFDEDYLRTLPTLVPGQTEREVSFLLEGLQLPPVGNVLDVGCGYGRHSMEIASRGHNVTGMDLSLPLLMRAADAARSRNLTVNFLHRDMREMTFDSEFDGAFCYMTTFGYFDDDANRKVATQIARALKPGGRLVLDIANRDYLIADLPARVWWQGVGCMVLEEASFNYFTSRLHVQRSVVYEDGRQSEQEISIRAYSLHEIGKVLHQAGFRVVEVSGGLAPALRGKFFGGDSRQILVVAEKKRD